VLILTHGGLPLWAGRTTIRTAIERHRASLLLVVAAALPAAGVAVWSLQRTARDVADPCTRWEVPQGSVVRLAPDDPCRHVSVQGWSRTQAETVAALVPGGVLVATVLAVAGAALRRKPLLFAGGFLMVLETFAVFTIAPLTLLAGVTFLLVAARQAQPT
jgi:hypothetical protein